VTQDIAPITSWLSPQFEFNFAGDHKIEAEVVTEVASYGKQLGILSDAVMELAEGKKGEAADRLKKLTDRIEMVKSQHKDRLEQKVKAGLALRASEINNYPKIAQDFGPDTRRFE
jgi:hypothetical protein